MKAFLTLTMVDGENTYAKTMQVVINETYMIIASDDRGLIVTGKDNILPIREAGNLPLSRYDNDVASPRLRLHSRVQVKDDDVIGGLQGTVIDMDGGEHDGEKCVMVKVDKDPTSLGYQVAISNLIVIH